VIDFKIIDLPRSDTRYINQAAQLLVVEFHEHSPESWTGMEAALEEVREALEPERICRAAVDEHGEMLGWIGGIPEYSGHAWELHPLVVRVDLQCRGVGGALVADLEDRVRERGATTIFLGTDDEDCRTSLGGRDLYPDVLQHIKTITNLQRHPYEFYLKQGYVIVGVIPDANGPGKPDILMAKRLSCE
jgi:aminoglycoside 6'-N-acetyltransferase I